MINEKIRTRIFIGVSLAAFAITGLLYSFVEINYIRKRSEIKNNQAQSAENSQSLSADPLITVIR